MPSERGGLAQTPGQLRLGAAFILAVAFAFGVFALAAGRPLFWVLVALFSGWSIYFLMLAAKWSGEDNKRDDHPSRTS
jgi:membrane protein implicated in regulation of membrane protease activity